MEKKTRAMFTKKSMIIDLKKIREDLIENEMTTTQIHLKYPSIYNYKIFEILLWRNYIKMTRKEVKKKFYRWNFDRKLNYNLFDFLYSHALKSKSEIYERNKKVNKNLVLEKPQTSNNNFSRKKKITSMSLAKEIRVEGESWSDALKRANKILRIRKLNTKPEQDEKIQQEIKSESIIELNEEMFVLDPFSKLEQEENITPDLISFEHGFKTEDGAEFIVIKKQSYLELCKKLNDNKGIELNIQKYETKIKNLELELHDYKYNVIKEEVTIKEENKKPLVSVLDEIKKLKINNNQPTKYLKLFGYMIYEKN